MKKKKSIANTIWIVILTIAALAWIYPIIMILMNSLKKESAISTGTAFKLPTADAFAGIANYVDCLLYTSPSPRDISGSRMPSSA